MKTKVLVLAAVLVFSVNIFAKNDKDKIVYSNNNKNTKEYIVVDSKTQIPMQKTIYKFDSEGKRKERITYTWNSEKGWIGLQKYAYNYNENNELTSYCYTEWNKQINTWNNNSQYLANK